MSLFFTNVRKYGKDLLVKEVHNGKRTRIKVPYKPYLFISSPTAQANPDAEYKTVFGKPVEKIDFETMKEAKEFIERYKDVSGFEYHGMTDFQYPFMNDNYSGEFDPEYIHVVSLDIETMSDDGFPNTDEADKEITVITMSLNGGEYIVIGNKAPHLKRGGDYKVHMPGVTYIECPDEATLLMTFIEKWEELDPDVVTGWNVKKFDMKYLVNRIRRILSEKWANRLSSWGIIQSRTEKDKQFDTEEEVFDIYGVETLDYMALYKKWTFVKREQYKLAHIAEVEELEVGKIDYSDQYKSLHDLYTNNYQLYVEYNIRDTEVINKLEDKLKLIALVFAVAYQAKVNYADTFSPVKTWDVIIHNLLMSRGMVVPEKSFSSGSEEFAGGFVKEPIPGLYNWVVSEDLDSLYPHLIMQFNISPEMYRGKLNFPGLSVDSIIDGALDDSQIVEYLKANNLAVCPNRTLWDRSKQGFLAELMETFYAERKQFKKMSIENKKKYEQTHDMQFKKLSILYDTIQLARKVLLNSAYGALANAFFRWTNKDFAEAITTGGQMVIQITSRETNKYFNKILDSAEIDFIIANDTDSMYVSFDRIVEKFCQGKSKQEIVDFIDKMCKEALEPYLSKVFDKIAVYTNAFANKMNMKREAIADRGVWTGKKRYILNVYDLEGVRFEVPKIKITGLEAVRSSVPAICREKFKESFKVIMNGTNDDMIDFIEEFRQQFIKLPFEKVAFPRTLNNLLKYQCPYDRWKSGAPIQVKGAIIFNELVDKRGLSKTLQKLKDGDNIRFSYLKAPNPGMDKVLTVQDELPEALSDMANYIDYPTQFEKAFLEPMGKILGVIGWTTEHRATLDCF